MENKLPAHEKAVWILKTRGPQPLSVLAQELKVTTEGARFQLQKLASEGLVEAISEARGRGRPQQVWSLTALGHARFPDTHAELTVKLITMMRETLGEEALGAVVAANERSGIQKYAGELSGIADLEGRVARLARVRSREGYMADYQKEDGGYLLVENHCPICAAAQACQGFCQSELTTFRAVLGEGVSVTRVDHILAGARRCVYRITPHLES